MEKGTSKITSGFKLHDLITTNIFSVSRRFIKRALTWILCKAAEASATLCGTSKHLAVLILALTNHCWKSLNAALNLCSNKRSLFWHSLDARRLRLTGEEQKDSLRPTGLHQNVLCAAHVLIQMLQMLRHCANCARMTEEAGKWGPERWAGMGTGQVEKWQSGWSGRNRRMGQRARVGDGGMGYNVWGGWGETYEWGESSQLTRATRTRHDRLRS